MLLFPHRFTYCPACGRYFEGRYGVSIKLATCMLCTARPALIGVSPSVTLQDTRNREKVRLAEMIIAGQGQHYR